MSSTTEQPSHRLDGLKWIFILLLLAGGIYANYHFSTQPLLFRVAGLLVVVAVAAFLALNTQKGASVWTLLKGAQTEARRVVWPSRQERNQTTLVVVGFILVMALILWGLDTLFGWLTSMIIG
ncbi:MAG: preprotein translocase subunit SecE [Porticoccaceae bacterium]|jgi:preprotein translocase subunit SecE|nr:preprotein translocase subunit SecE [Porticoccaceae bacterium]HLS99833.1 preprotein translocase subunit SecE [Porticoccaceae bacterium]